MKWFAPIMAATTLACTTGLAAAGEAAGASPVYDVNNPIVHPYMQTATTTSCGTTCTITFPAATRPNTLVQHVSCFFNLPNSVTTYTAEAYTSVTNGVNMLSVFNYQGSGVQGVRGINDNIYLFLKSGESLVVYVQSNPEGDIAQLSCTISGYHN